jgi:hypothetical protein
MKTYVIMVARHFPKKHPKEGQPTQFMEQIHHGKKIHTIRKNYDLWERRIKEVQEGRACLSLREWSGIPYQSKQIELERFDKSDGVGIEAVYQTCDLHFLDPEITNQISTKHLAENDGLSLENFEGWFPPVIKIKKMAIIHFTLFRYH